MDIMPNKKRPGRPTALERARATCPLPTPWSMRQEDDHYVLCDARGGPVAQVQVQNPEPLGRDALLRMIAGAGVMYEHLLAIRWLAHAGKDDQTGGEARKALIRVRSLKISGKKARPGQHRLYYPPAD